MSDWPLNDFQLVTAAILGVMVVVLIVTAFRKAGVTRREFVCSQGRQTAVRGNERNTGG